MPIEFVVIGIFGFACLCAVGLRLAYGAIRRPYTPPPPQASAPVCMPSRKPITGTIIAHAPLPNFTQALSDAEQRVNDRVAKYN